MEDFFSRSHHVCNNWFSENVFIPEETINQVNAMEKKLVWGPDHYRLSTYFTFSQLGLIPVIPCDPLFTF